MFCLRYLDLNEFLSEWNASMVAERRDSFGLPIMMAPTI